MDFAGQAFGVGGRKLDLPGDHESTMASSAAGGIDSGGGASDLPAAAIPSGWRTGAVDGVRRWRSV